MEAGLEEVGKTRNLQDVFDQYMPSIEKALPATIGKERFNRIN